MEKTEKQGINVLIYFDTIIENTKMASLEIKQEGSEFIKDNGFIINSLDHIKFIKNFLNSIDL